VFLIIFIFILFTVLVQQVAARNVFDDLIIMVLG